MKRDEVLSKQAWTCYQQGWIKRSKSFCHKFNSAFAFWKFAAIHSSLISKTQLVVPNYEGWSGKRLRSSFPLKRRAVTSWSCWQISKVGLRTCIDSSVNGVGWKFVAEHCKPAREGDELSSQAVCKGVSWGLELGCPLCNQWCSSFQRCSETWQHQGVPRRGAQFNLFFSDLTTITGLPTELEIVCLASWCYDLVYYTVAGTLICCCNLKDFMILYFLNGRFPKAANNSGDKNEGEWILFFLGFFLFFLKTSWM